MLQSPVAVIASLGPHVKQEHSSQGDRRSRAPIPRVPVSLERPRLVLWIVWAGGPSALAVAVILKWSCPHFPETNWLVAMLVGLAVLGAQMVTALAMLALVFSRRLRSTPEYWLLSFYWAVVAGWAVTRVLLTTLTTNAATTFRWLDFGIAATAVVTAIATPLVTVLRWRRDRDVRSR